MSALTIKLTCSHKNNFLIRPIPTLSLNYNRFTKEHFCIYIFHFFNSDAVFNLIVTMVLCFPQQGPQGFTGPPGEPGEAGASVSVPKHSNESDSPVSCLGELLLTVLSLCRVPWAPVVPLDPLERTERM